MEIRKLRPDEANDFLALIHIFRDVLENPGENPPVEHLQHLLAKPDFMVFVARVNDTVVGGLTLYVLHAYYHVKPLAYLYDVGIAAEYQGQGIGKALMAEVCRFCQANGFEEAYVEAEAEDLEAIRFYRQTHPDHELNAVHFTYAW